MQPVILIGSLRNIKISFHPFMETITYKRIHSNRVNKSAAAIYQENRNRS